MSHATSRKEITRERKISPSDKIIKNNVALEIFDATALLRSLIRGPNLTVPPSFLPLAVQTAYANLFDALDQFALSLSNGCCVLSKKWICFLLCLLSSIVTNSTLITIQAQIGRIRNAISTLPTSSNEKDLCTDSCASIVRVLSAITQLISAAFSYLAGQFDFGTVIGSALNNLSVSILNLSQAIGCQSEKCELLPCVLLEVFAAINTLTATFIITTPAVGIVLIPVTNILTSITVDCLRELTSKAAKIDKDLKQTLCQVQISIDALLALVSTPIAIVPVLVPIL
jgi:hypothetical protein